MAATNTAPYSPDMTAVHGRLRVAGKEHKVLIVIMRELIILANRLLCKGSLWIPEPTMVAGALPMESLWTTGQELHLNSPYPADSGST